MRAPGAFIWGAVVYAALPRPVLAQTKPVQFSIASTVTATTNGSLSPAGSEQSDLILSVIPRASVSRFGANLALRGDLGAELIASKNSTREDRVLPQGAVSMAATLVERAAFLDASADLRQVESNPYGSRVEQGSTQNLRTEGSARISPTIKLDLDRETSVQARADLGVVKYSGGDENDSRDGKLAAKFSVAPRPVGGWVDLSSQRVKYGGAAQNDWGLDSAVLGVSVSTDPEWVVGVTGGADHETAQSGVSTDSRAGLTALWLPTSRSTLSASVEHRFFGTGFNVGVSHRSPYGVVSLRALREPLIPSLPGIGGRGSLPTFLDAILTTRYPDPAQRAAHVADITSSRGLPTSIQGTAGATSNYAQLASGADCSVVLQGSRNTFVASFYQQTVTLLTHRDDTLQFVGPADADNRQRGTTFEFNRRLSPSTTFDLQVRWSQIDGLAARAGDRTTERDARAGLVVNASPRTSVSVGAQHRRSQTNVAGSNSFEELSAFTGIAHRF